MVHWQLQALPLTAVDLCEHPHGVTNHINDVWHAVATIGDEEVVVIVTPYVKIQILQGRQHGGGEIAGAAV